MFSIRNILARNIIKMGKPIKPRGIVKPTQTHTNRTRTFASSSALSQQNVQPSVPIPTANTEETMLFSDLGKDNLLNPILLKTIAEDLKFDAMMPVQSATLHDLLKNRVDMLAQAKTGTGKTLAFLLPAIQTLINKNKGPRKISLLVMTPTRELAIQIATEATALLKRFPKYKVCLAIGGTKKNVEESQILQGCNILVATPGRLNDHLSNEAIVGALDTLDTLVLDEADRLLDMGFMKALEEIVGKLPDKDRTNRQGMLFSATMAPHVHKCARLVLGPGYKSVSTIAEGDLNTHDRVPQLLITVPEFKDVAPAMVGSILSEVKTLGKEFKAVIFAPTAALVDWYVAILEKTQGIPKVEGVHSRHSQSKRSKVTDWYRGAKTGILVATDVVARGMDFPGVSNVFQVGLPADKESYIHRLGRTARAGREGRGVFITTQAESFFPKYTLKEISFVPTPADLSSANQVQTAAKSYENKSKVYQAWLGYYKNHCKAMGWDNAALVRQANQFALTGLAADEVPGLEKSTAGKMGLKGVPGLVYRAAQPTPARGSGQGRKRDQQAFPNLA